MALTRHGDILVIDDGTLRFTYRFGRWQYWNHTHLVDLLRNSARVQRVAPGVVPKVVNSIYRAALDVSFRRTGGLFLILRNRKKIDEVVRRVDQIGHQKREVLHREFDGALTRQKVQDFPRSVLVDLAALDGAIVVSNDGQLMAYGAILAPQVQGGGDVEEASRTKAAKAASTYGLAVKVSADGDISVYVRQKEFFGI